MRVFKVCLVGTSLAVLGGCVGNGESEAQLSEAIESSLPRRIGPLTGATLTSRRPAFRWDRALANLHVQVCADAACATIQQDIVTSGRSVQPTGELSSGVHFWRLAAGASASKAWRFVVPRRDATHSTVTGYLPDFNGDGYTDLVVSAPFAAIDPRGIPPKGKAYVYYGTSSGLPSTPSLMFGPEMAAAGFGDGIGRYALTSLGDVNGDGYSELATSTSLGVALFYGAASGVTSPTTLLSGRAYAVSAGDVNGDGYGDAIIDAGLYLGGATGLASSAVFTWATGARPVSMGDVNGDGRADVGVQGANGPLVHFGTSTGVNATARSLRLATGFVFESFANAGDLNADGNSDLAVKGATPAGERAVFIYFGTSTGYRATADATLLAPVARSAFGTVLAAAGDVNGDGYGDLLALSEQPGSGSGTVYLHVYTGGDGSVSAAPLTTLSGSGVSRFAHRFGNVGDVDGDGFDDVLVGHRGASDYFSGALYLYPGASTGLSSTPALTLREGGTNGSFSLTFSAWQ